MSNIRSNSFNTAINILSSVGVLVTNLLISFFLSPYIIKTIGVEANGFVNLANNFVTYADLIVTALNAMAARFITLAYIEKDYKKANMYYNSVFWGNLIIVAMLLLPAVCFIVRLENYVDVPSDILFDVKILFSIVFFSFFLKTAAPNWDCGTYITNRLDRSYIPSMITALFRCVFLFCIFSILTPHVWYVGVSSAIINVILLVVAGYNTYKLTPELKINLKKPICSLNTIKELVGSGIWNSISSCGNMLLNGLDLLICNIFLGATSMGVLSLAKTLPSILTQLAESIRGAFGPELTINYAKGNKKQILDCIQRAMKITSVVVTIPTACIIVMGDIFYSLWVPSQDAKLLQVLSALSVVNYIFGSGTVILANVFTTVNRVRYNSFAMIISGGMSIIITFLLMYFTNLDIYAVAGVSSIIFIVRNLLFVVPITAKLLGYKWYQFYSQVGVSIICSGLNIVVGIIVRMFIPVDSWVMFIVACCIIGVIGLTVNMIIVLNKEEREYLVGIIKRKLKRS